jgi:hypothetical protein
MARSPPGAPLADDSECDHVAFHRPAHSPNPRECAILRASQIPLRRYPHAQETLAWSLRPSSRPARAAGVCTYRPTSSRRTRSASPAGLHDLLELHLGRGVARARRNEHRSPRDMLSADLSRGV